MENNKMLQNAKIYECKKCLFTCSKQSNYNTHLLTTKHRRKLQETKGNNGNTNNATIVNTYICSNCNKTYATKSGLWKHEKNVSTNMKTPLLQLIMIIMLHLM